MGKMRKLLVGALLVAAGTVAMAHSDGGYVDNDFFKGMKKGDKAAVLMVHFGTTYDDARALSIDAINNKAKKEFKGVDVKEAFTSRIVMRRLKERGIETRVIKTEALVGGGAMPDEKIRSYGIAFKNDIHSLEERFRKCETPIIGRTKENMFILDLKAIREEEFQYIVEEAERIIL